MTQNVSYFAQKCAFFKEGGDSLTPQLLKKEIKSAQAWRGMTREELATRMHMSPDQLDRRLRHPERIKLCDLIEFDRILKLNLFNK